MIWEVYLLFNDEFFNAKRFSLIYFTASYLGFNITYLSIYIWWTKYMGYNFPMPFYVLPCGYIALVNMCVAFWFGFPRELRIQTELRKRLKYYLLYLAICLTIPYQEILLDTIDNLLKAKNVQWIQGFIIPIFIRFYQWALPKQFNRAAGRENEAATFYVETFIGCAYALYVTVRLIDASESTANCILGVEFFINLCGALRIISMHNKVQGNMTAEEITKLKTKKEAMIRNLVTMESIEILIPLAYSVCYTTAYYGPNAGVMAGVKNTYFCRKEMDIENVITSLFKMAGLDGCGAIIIGLLLGKLCQINIFGEFCVILKKHWMTITVTMGSCIFYVRNIVSNTEKQVG